MVQAKLTIIGKVQGVFYRSYAQKMAQKLGLSGWIKNEPDGTVSALVQGEESALKEFINWCKEGSPVAKVKEVDVVLESVHEKIEGFHIK